MGNLNNEHNIGHNEQNLTDFYKNTSYGPYDSTQPSSGPQPDAIAQPNPDPEILVPLDQLSPSGQLNTAQQPAVKSPTVTQPAAHVAPQPVRPQTSAPSDGLAQKPRARRSGLLTVVLLLLFIGLALGAAYFAGLLPSYYGTVSDSSVTSYTDYNPIISSADAPKYPIVHIEGIVLPDEYADGYMDPDAAFYIINEYRANNGLAKLSRVNEATMQASLTRLTEIYTVFSHTRPDGTKFSSVFSEYNVLYLHVSENLAEGQFTAEKVILDWIESESHNNNLLDPDITHAAITCGINSDGVPMWIFHGMQYAE